MKELGGQWVLRVFGVWIGAAGGGGSSLSRVGGIEGQAIAMRTEGHTLGVEAELQAGHKVCVAWGSARSTKREACRSP
jgi:hypothetical protein